MKRMRIVGLCLFAAFAMSATVVASAAAIPNVPRVGRCIKGVAGSGQFSDANCKAKATEAAKELYEFYPVKGLSDRGQEKALVGETYKSEAIGTNEKPIVLTGTGEKLGAETKVECKLQKSDGKVEGAEEETAEHIIYTGCESGGVPCQTGATAGEIAVENLKITFVIEKFGYNTTTHKDEPAKDKVAEKLVPKVGTKFVEFNCGAGGTLSLHVNVESLGNEGLMVPAKTNAMVTASEVKFSGLKGNQKPEKYGISIEESTGHVTYSGEVSLVAAFVKPGLTEEKEESGQTQTNKVNTTTKLEINTVA